MARPFDTSAQISGREFDALKIVAEFSYTSIARPTQPPAKLSSLVIVIYLKGANPSATLAFTIFWMRYGLLQS
jgi:hypothetical protein